MALPSSSTLCLVLLLMPAAHSVPCTPRVTSELSYLDPSILLLCCSAVSRTYYISRVLTQRLQAFAHAGTGNVQVCAPLDLP